MPDLMFFQDEDETPRLPHQVEITEVQVRPLPDRRRVTVQVTLTPFIDNPDFDVTILRPDGGVERTLSVVSAMDRTNTLTMHLSRPSQANHYIVRVDLIHDGNVIQSCETPFTIPNAAGASSQT